MRKSYYWRGAGYTIAAVGVSVLNAVEVLPWSSVGTAVVGPGDLGLRLDLRPDRALRARIPLPPGR